MTIIIQNLVLCYIYRNPIPAYYISLKKNLNFNLPHENVTPRIHASYTQSTTFFHTSAWSTLSNRHHRNLPPLTLQPLIILVKSHCFPPPARAHVSHPVPANPATGYPSRYRHAYTGPRVYNIYVPTLRKARGTPLRTKYKWRAIYPSRDSGIRSATHGSSFLERGRERWYPSFENAHTKFSLSWSYQEGYLARCEVFSTRKA